MKLARFRKFVGKFVDNEPIWVNPEQVTCVEMWKDGAVIELLGDRIVYTAEPLDVVVATLTAASA